MCGPESGPSGSSMRRARSVTGPLRRAHPASGATWNVQVVRGKMSSKCLWHACRALSAGLLLMLLGAAMAVIGYYADILSVDQEIRGNATVSVKDEARGFHLNNLSYVGPIVMGFGGFIVVAACVMTFEARDSAAKVTPARPTALPRPLPRRGPPCAAPARLDQLGVYRLPHVLPLPHSLPLAPLHTHRHRPVQAPASAAESECGSQSSLALDLHASGACAGVTLRVRDNTRRRPLARQQRLRDDTVLATPIGSSFNIDNPDGNVKTPGEASNTTVDTTRLSVEGELRASSAPPLRTSPPPSPGLAVTTPPEKQTCIIIEPKQIREEMEKQTNSIKTNDEITSDRDVVLNMDINNLQIIDQVIVQEVERQIELQVMAGIAIHEAVQAERSAGETEENQNQTGYNNEPRHIEFLGEEEAAQYLLESHPAYTLEYIEDTETEELPTLEFPRVNPEVVSMPTEQEVDNTEEETVDQARESEENPESDTNTQNPPPNI